MNTGIIKAFAYYRLSNDEIKRGVESESITNQRMIVHDYCNKHGIIILTIVSMNSESLNTYTPFIFVSP